MHIPIKYFGSLVLLLALLVETSCEDMQVADEQFVKVHFHYGLKNELNTFELTYQKDLVMDGVISTDFWFTAEELEEILAKAEQHHFFQLPDTIKPQKGVMVKPDPGWQFLRIKHEDRDHTVSWYNLLTWFYPQPEYEEYVPDLRVLVDYLIELIESKPAYKSLPLA